MNTHTHTHTYKHLWNILHDLILSLFVGYFHLDEILIVFL